MTKNNDAFTPDASKPASENAINRARHRFVSVGLNAVFADLVEFEKRGNLPDLNQRIETTRRAIESEKPGSVRAIQARSHLDFLEGLHGAASEELSSEFRRLLKLHAAELVNDLRRLTKRFDEEAERVEKRFRDVYEIEGWLVPDSIGENPVILALKNFPRQHVDNWVGTFEAIEAGQAVGNQLDPITWPLAASGWQIAYQNWKKTEQDKAA